MDWKMTNDAETAMRFGLSLPCGFGTDYAGVVDQVGDGVTDFAPGEHCFVDVTAFAGPRELDALDALLRNVPIEVALAGALLGCRRRVDLEAGVDQALRKQLPEFSIIFDDK